MQNLNVDLDYDDSDDELSESDKPENRYYPTYEAQMKMKYTGHRNARFVQITDMYKVIKVMKSYKAKKIVIDNLKNILSYKLSSKFNILM